MFGAFRMPSLGSASPPGGMERPSEDGRYVTTEQSGCRLVLVLEVDSAKAAALRDPGPTRPPHSKVARVFACIGIRVFT